MSARHLLRALLPAVLVAGAAVGALPSPASAVMLRLAHGGYANVDPLLGARAPRAASMFDQAFSNLDYSGGPVMPSNTNFAVVWQPSGYAGAGFQSGYTAGVDQFFTDLAADSGTHANSDAVSAQYGDAFGNTAAYASHDGGLIADSDPLPANGCSSGAICLTDAQLETELDGFLAAHGLPADLTHEYFLLTPPSVAICADAADCSANATLNRTFCAYHSETGAGYVYAVIPDLAGVTGCDPFVTGCPGATCSYDNGPADGVLSAVSHEHNESITDPEPGTGWADWQTCGQYSPAACGGEIGDKCNGDALSDPNVQLQDDGSGHDTPYNETVGPHHYLLQREWSNQTERCLDGFASNGSVAGAAFTDSSGGGYTVDFDAGSSTATGGVAEYVWQFGDGPGPTTTSETTSPAVQHAFPRPGTYHVALTVMSGDGTSSATVATVVVGQAPVPVAAFTTSGTTVVGGPVSFDGRGSTGAVATYLWSFGDGTTATGPTATHIYAAARSYTVTLTVLDSVGRAASMTKIVPISARAPVNPPKPPACVVPRLKGRSLGAAQRLLAAAHCRVGRVSRPRRKPRGRRRWNLVVAKSSPGAGARERNADAVGLKLAYARA